MSLRHGKSEGILKKKSIFIALMIILIDESYFRQFVDDRLIVLSSIDL